MGRRPRDASRASDRRAAYERGRVHPVSDRIEIRGLRVVGHHGVLAHERADGQLFVVDADLDVDLSAAAASDDLADTVDYGKLAERLAAEVRGTRFDLIEALAGHLADIAIEDARVAAAQVRVAKPQAPVAADLDEVAVVVRRTAAGTGAGEGTA